MEFLNPSGLYALTLLPLLLILYLKRRRRRIVFSSLLLLRDFSVGASSASWARIRLPLLFFLQLMFLALLVFGFGDPVLTTQSPATIAILLDNSASMQTMEDEKSRFEIAKNKARQLLGSLATDTKVSLFLTLPGLKSHGADLTPAEALPLVKPMRPYDLGESRGQYGGLLSRLYRKGSYDRIIFFTNHRVKEPSGAMEIISVGKSRGNVAITSFKLARSFSTDRLHATLEVTNYDSQVRKVKLLLKGGGKALATKTPTVAPGKTATIFLEGFPYRSYYKAELQLRDALSLDNVRYGVAPSRDGKSVLGISPRRAALLSLRNIPGLRVKVISPRAYQDNGGQGQTLEIFHYTAPKALPENDALFVLPPKGNPLVSLGGSLSQPAITDWREPHSLTRYVNFALFQPTYGRALVPPILANIIIEGPEGPLAVVVRRNGYRYLVLGFDPFPYFSEANLPMSIFTLNLLSWFFEEKGASTTVTGEPFRLPDHEGAMLTGPKGLRVHIGEGNALFSDTFLQGIYRVTLGEKEKIKAVNFDNLRESDLSQPALLKLKPMAVESPAPAAALPLWPYLVLVSILLLFLEWFLNPIAARGAVPSAQGIRERRA